MGRVVSQKHIKNRNWWVSTVVTEVMAPPVDRRCDPEHEDHTEKSVRAGFHKPTLTIAMPGWHFIGPRTTAKNWSKILDRNALRKTNGRISRFWSRSLVPRTSNNDPRLRFAEDFAARNYEKSAGAVSQTGWDGSAIHSSGKALIF